MAQHGRMYILLSRHPDRKKITKKIADKKLLVKKRENLFKELRRLNKKINAIDTYVANSAVMLGESFI